MIYVEEKEFSRQIELLSFFASSQDLNICVWLYPESNVSELAGIKVTENPLSLSPVTTYGDGFSPKCTAPISASISCIGLFGSAYTDLQKKSSSALTFRFTLRYV